jgi:PKD repeat protein
MRVARWAAVIGVLTFVGLLAGSSAEAQTVQIVAPDDGEILQRTVELQANVTLPGVTSVVFQYRPHEAAVPTVALPATFDASRGLWVASWDTRLVLDTFNEIDTNGDGTEDTTVNLTKPPTNDELMVVATAPGPTTATAAIDVRIQNMLTARIFLPDNQEDIRGFEDLEVLVTSRYDVTSVRFDLYDFPADADPRIPTAFGEFQTLGEPIENPHYGRPLGTPAFPLGAATHEIGAATPQGARRWVLRNWDTTVIPDGTYLLVATAQDAGDPGAGIAPRSATYMVETYIVNDLKVVITAPSDGASVSRFVALEARTSSMTGADNAAPGSLFPATSVVFTIGATNISATETPSGSGRWRAVWNGDAFTPGSYTITATATNANPAGAETAVDTASVTLVAPGTALDAFFPFDWGNCTLQVCSFLDGSSGGPTSWLWEFGDGNTSTDQLPTHTYASPGVYLVRLTVSNDGGTTTDTYERRIPVGNIAVVSFNRNSIDEAGSQFIDWTSAFKEFEYTVGGELAVPVMWKTTTGKASFAALPTEVCDDDEESSNQECVIFTPEEAFGTAPVLVGAAEDGVLFTIRFTDVQFRGITDAFKGKVNLRLVVDVDTDGDGTADQQNQLGTNVDVTNTGVGAIEETRSVTVISPFQGQFVGGTVAVTAATVSSLTADQVEFFVNGVGIGVDTDGSNGWSASWDTTGGSDGQYALTAVASFGGSLVTSDSRDVTVENALPPGEPPAPSGTFQTGRVNDTTGRYITYPAELEQGGGGPPGGQEPSFNASMTAVIQNIAVIPGRIEGESEGELVRNPDAGVIGGDAIEFDVVITNTSPASSGAVLSAYAFQSKFSESPALASRIGDKAFYGVLVPGAHPMGPMVSVKKNGTSNGLFSGRWKGICINSSEDFLPEFNSGLNDESLECAGNRADMDFDGEPEILTGDDMLGLRPGQSQTVRVRIEAGTTDGALHVVQPGTIRGGVAGLPIVGPNGLTYFVPEIDNAGIADPNVIAIPDFGDNKVLRNADGAFNPTFAPLSDELTFNNQIYLTLPRANFAFTDILGRNHTCETYGLTAGSCAGNPGGSPVFGFLDTGDLVPGTQNFAAILHGFGEYVETSPGQYAAPNFPYGVPCINLATPDGLRCGARPFTPIAEFYRDNGDGSITRQMVAGSYGALGSPSQYTATIATATGEWKEEQTPEEDPGGPCDPVADPESRRPQCAQLRTSASGHFHSLNVLEEAGINGGDVVEFTIDITNTSTNPQAYLTAFNYQTKRRGLADIGTLDGFSQDRRDIRGDTTLPPCNSLNQGACFNPSLGVGHFPNVIGNGLLFGQMVWQSGRVDRAGQTIVEDFVAVDPSGIDPEPFKLESVKKNGPFTPILKGNVNFICVKSGLFFPDQDADAACAGVPAILHDPDGELVPGNIDQRLGLAPGETQSVRIRMEYGDFRGALLQVLAGTLTGANVDSRYTSTQGLARFFDCEDQRELEFCHPNLVGANINYLPNTTATWLTPQTLEEIEFVIINQPGDAARIMNFQQNFGLVLAMAGFVPTAEFYAPDPNPELVGTPLEGVLIRQQVIGSYAATDAPELAPMIVSAPVTTGSVSAAFTYTVQASAYPAASYSLDQAPSGMSIDAASGLVQWTPSAGGAYPVSVRATNTAGTVTQSFTINVASPVLDDFNRKNALRIGGRWTGATGGYAIYDKQAFATLGGPVYWSGTGSSFGVNQQVSVELSSLGYDLLGRGLLLKVQGSTANAANGAIRVEYDRRHGRVRVETLRGGQKKWTVYAAVPVTFARGDTFGAQALADGTVRVLRNGASVASVSLNATDKTWFQGRGGRLGLWLTPGLGVGVDNFAGGSLQP